VKYPLYEVIDHMGYRIEIIYDENPLNPRTEWDNLGKMLCFHNRYELGDKHPGLMSSNFSDWGEIREYIENELKGVVILPVFMYDHSGITVRTTPFGDYWDSGQIGFIYITEEKIIKEYGKCDQETLEKVKTYLEGEIENYDDYLTGQVYGYRVLRKEKCECCGTDLTKNNEVDSCWGFYGEDGRKEARNQAIAAAKYDAEKEAKGDKEDKMLDVFLEAE